MVRREEVADHGRRLGHAVALREVALEHLHRPPQRLLRDRRRAVGDLAQVLVLALRDVRYLDEQRLDHRGNERAAVDALLVERAHDLRRDEVGLDERQAPQYTVTNELIAPAAWYIGTTMSVSLAGLTLSSIVTC